MIKQFNCVINKPYLYLAGADRVVLTSSSELLSSSSLPQSTNAKYIFTTSVIPNREIVHQFDIHGQLIYLTKLIAVQENINNRKWYHFAYAITTSGSTGVPKLSKYPIPVYCPILRI